jgi:hypothetical protein
MTSSSFGLDVRFWFWNRIWTEYEQNFGRSILNYVRTGIWAFRFFVPCSSMLKALGQWQSDLSIPDRVVADSCYTGFSESRSSSSTKTHLLYWIQAYNGLDGIVENINPTPIQIVFTYTGRQVSLYLYQIGHNAHHKYPSPEPTTLFLSEYSEPQADFGVSKWFTYYLLNILNPCCNGWKRPDFGALYQSQTVVWNISRD